MACRAWLPPAASLGAIVSGLGARLWGAGGREVTTSQGTQGQAGCHPLWLAEPLYAPSLPVRGCFLSQCLGRHADLASLCPPGRWTALPDFPDYHKWGFSLAALNNDVYVTGGQPAGPFQRALPSERLAWHRPPDPLSSLAGPRHAGKARSLSPGVACRRTDRPGLTCCAPAASASPEGAGGRVAPVLSHLRIWGSL